VGKQGWGQETGDQRKRKGSTPLDRGEKRKPGKGGKRRGKAGGAKKKRPSKRRGRHPKPSAPEDEGKTIRNEVSDPNGATRRDVGRAGGEKGRELEPGEGEGREKNGGETTGKQAGRGPTSSGPPN